MYQKISTYIISIALFAAAPAFCESTAPAKQSSSLPKTPATQKQRYTCVMHPEVITDHPGKCPKCGMTLVPLQEKPHDSTHQVAAIDHNRQSHEHDHTESAGANMNMQMSSSINLADPMSRESSGTAWVPD